MFRNMIKTALRSFSRQKGYTAINIAGLTVGLAGCFLILVWINDEINMDKFHINDARIYQVKRLMHQDDGQTIVTLGIPQPLEIVLEEEYAEVDKVAVLSWDIEFLFQAENEIFKEVGRYASPELFEIFSFPFIIGDPALAMNDVHSLVISRNMAEKLFGANWRSEALGKLVNVDNRQEFKVTGVFENIPGNSSLQFEWVIPAEEYVSRNAWIKNWGNSGFRMILTLNEGADLEAFGAKLENEVNDNKKEGNEPIFVQKYSEQYLYGNFENGVQQGGRIDYVKILAVVAFFIIVIACINFINLATARSATRAREIGVRKVLGAGGKSLKLQFMTEAMLITLGSTVLAVLIVQLLLTPFNVLTGKEIIINYASYQFWLTTLTISLFAGLLSGGYPAFFLSSMKALNVIKGKPQPSHGVSYFRQGLVIVQFVMSMFLIIGTVVVYRQIGFILNKNVGMDRENLIYLDLEGSTRENFETFKTELMRLPEVSHVTSSDQSPFVVSRSSGSAHWEGRNPESQIEISVISATEGFIETMKMELLSGRGFSGDFHRDSVSYIINEKAAGIMGMKDPINKDLYLWGNQGKIIGMVKDFHMTSLHDEIEPLIIRYAPWQTPIAFVRITGNLSNALAGIEEVTRSFNPGFPFNFTFLDQEYEEIYRGEMVIGSLAKYFTAVAIFISCLGLLGLSSYTAQQRAKEISIRKVMGASVSNLVFLLSATFSRLVAIAFIIAIPIAYYFTNDWLNQFAYRTALHVGIFIIAGLVTLVIAAVTVSFKAYKVAVSNPVDWLKEE